MCNWFNVIYMTWAILFPIVIISVRSESVLFTKVPEVLARSPPFWETVSSVKTSRTFLSPKYQECKTHVQNNSSSAFLFMVIRALNTSKTRSFSYRFNAHITLMRMLTVIFSTSTSQNFCTCSSQRGSWKWNCFPLVFPCLCTEQSAQVCMEKHWIKTTKKICE